MRSPQDAAGCRTNTPVACQISAHQCACRVLFGEAVEPPPPGRPCGTQRADITSQVGGVQRLSVSSTRCLEGPVRRRMAPSCDALPRHVRRMVHRFRGNLQQTTPDLLLPFDGRAYPASSSEIPPCIIWQQLSAQQSGRSSLRLPREDRRNELPATWESSRKSKVP